MICENLVFSLPNENFNFRWEGVFVENHDLFHTYVYTLREVQEFGGRGGAGGREGWAGGRGGYRKVSLLPPSGGPIFHFQVPLRFAAAM